MVLIGTSWKEGCRTYGLAIPGDRDPGKVSHQKELSADLAQLLVRHTSRGVDRGHDMRPFHLGICATGDYARHLGEAPVRFGISMLGTSFLSHKHLQGGFPVRMDIGRFALSLSR